MHDAIGPAHILEPRKISPPSTIPPFGKDRSQFPHDRAVQRDEGITPGGSPALPFDTPTSHHARAILLADVHAAGKADATIHHQQLTVITS